MSSTIYFLAEHYPFWGIPLALICFELARFFWRNGRRLRAVLSLGLSGLLVFLAVWYFMDDGFRNVRPALTEAEKTYTGK